MPHRSKIFFLEDDREDQELIQKAFSSFDRKEGVCFFTHPMALLDCLQNGNGDEDPTLIVLNYSITQLNGLQALQQIRQMKR